MKNKTVQLDHLFDKWKKNYEPYRDNFKSDGVNNEATYDKMKQYGKAVLFIAKEPNDPKQSPGDFRTWWHGKWSDRFSNRIGEWGYGLTKDFPVYKEAIENKYHGMQSIAFMNLKKSGGGGTANYKNIMDVVEDTQMLLKDEVSIIDPDIILGCGIYEKAWDLLFGEIKWLWCGYDIKIAKWNNVKLIAYYHPSNRYPKAMNYCLLEKVYKSQAFNEL